ncbi:MAG: DUF58 domain-containing protein [Synergistaceae bacterium]|jgi:uncharacterized protein (DUF58 family)|nr:DUF58 domain-containing protein [Synergistaceae bacterium]
MTRPTLRAALCFSLSVPAALLIVSLWEGRWYLALYYPSAVLALIAADAIMALPDRALDAGVSTPDPLYVGRGSSVGLKLRAPGRARPLKFQALLEHTGPADDPPPASGVMTDGRLDLGFGISPRRRGRLSVDAVWIRWRGPLGLIEVRRRQAVGVSVGIAINVKGIHEAAIRFSADLPERGEKPLAYAGEGSEFEDMREYRQGMDCRMIDWKSSARHRKILCKRFTRERNHHVVMGFDTGRLMLERTGEMTKLDHAARAGLTLGWAALNSGDLLGGCGFDARFRSFIKPERGMTHFARFQRFTSDLEYRMEETNFTLALAELNSRLRQRSLVILFTEFVDMISAELMIESLRWMTRRHVVIFVTMRDPELAKLRGAAPRNFESIAEAVIADDFLRERAVVLERISRLGIHCLDVPAGGLSGALLNRYLLIKRRGMI